MASFSVDITEVVFAAGNTGYKDITISNMPSGGVNCSITSGSSYFGYRIPGSDQNVYRVYTTGTNDVNTVVRNGVFKITNANDSSDYLEISLYQLKYGYVDTGGVLMGCVVDVICESPSIVNRAKGTDSIAYYNDVYADYNNGGDSTAKCTVLLDGSWSIPSSSNIPDWVSLVSNTVYTDTGFKQVYVSFVNNYSGPRSGDIQFGSNSNYDWNYVHCNQDGYPSSTSGCSPVVLTFPKAGDTLSVTVMHPSAVDASHIHTNNNLFAVFGSSYSITTSDSSSTEAIVSIQIPQNTSSDLKEGGVVEYYYISNNVKYYLGHTVVKQLGDGPVQTLTVDPASLSYSATGGGKVLNVTYATSLSTNTFPSWLSATYVTTGAGSRSYTITATANSSSESRSFNLVLSDANMSVTVPISQTGGTPASLTISPTSGSVGYAAGTVNITVTSSGISSVDFNISDTSWVGYNGKSGDVYTFYYSSNTGAVSRTNTIVFSGGGLSRTYTLTQSAMTPSDFTISPTSGLWSKGGATGSDDGYVNFTNQVNPVTATPSDSWISVTIQSDRAYVTVSENNTGSQRTGTITFTDDTGTSRVYTVTQVGNNIVFDPSSVSFNADGTGGPSELYGFCNTTTYTQDALHPVSNTVPSWLHISTIGITRTRVSFSITADENTSTSSRSATVDFSEMNGQYTGSLQVTQAGASAPSFSISPTSGTVNSDAGTVRITVTGSNISYSSSQGWLSYSSVSGNVYTFSYTANTSASQRTAVITFISGSQSGTYTLTQMGGSTPPPTGDGYDPIWMDDYYIPAGWSPSSGDNRYYPYMLKDELTGAAIYEGTAVIPAGWGGSVGGINIPRIVENFLNSDFYYSHSGWNNMVYSYRTIGLYNMSNPLSPQLVETFKYFNDWSRCRTVYNRSQILNDPINFKGCQHMYMPLCVFCNDSSTFSIFSVGLEGDTETYYLGNPGYTFAQETDRFTGVKRLDYKMNGETIYSYDMTHCGPGALIYRNRFGGWDSFLIEGNVEKSEDYIKQNYTLPDDNFNRTLRFRNNRVTMRNNITTTYEANTGWLSDEESERLVFHLLSSPQVWYQNFEINQFDTDRDGDYGMHPVRITNSTAKYKKFRNGRILVSYTITFEDSNTIQVMR